MSCSRLSRRPPRPVSCLLPVLLALAWLGGATACRAEPSQVGYTHPIELAAGDFVRAIVEQRSDVRIELLDPDGREILHVDGPNSIRDDEEVAAVVERTGRYQLKVLGCPRSAPAADCYTLRLDPPRPATDADRQRAEAVRTTQEAVDAMPKTTEESWRFQLATRERALELWRGLGDRGREAEELYQLGSLLHPPLHQPDSAARRFHEAAEIWAALGDITREAEALNQAGCASEEIGHLDHAQEDYRLALARAREVNDRKTQRYALNNLGLLLNRLGERQEALGYFEEALKLAGELGSEDGRPANILNSLGTLYIDLGDPQKAIDLFNQSLAVAGASSLERAAAYNNLGTVYGSLGDWEQAVKNYNLAIAINRQQGDRYRLASTLNNLGVAQHNSGDLKAARASYQEALTFAGKTKNLDVQIHAADNFAFLLDQKLGEPQEALEQWREVVRLAEEYPVLDHVGLAARAAIERGEKKLIEARATLQKAIAGSRKKAELRFAADLTLRLARVERELGDLAAAADHAEEAVKSIESQRNRVASLDQRALFLASNQTFYELYIRVLMELHLQHPGKGYDTRALTISERARARSLLDLLGEAESGLRRGVPPQILENEQKTRARLRELDLHHMELIHQGAGQEQIAGAAARLREAVEDFEKVEAALRESSVSYAALTPQPLDVGAIQKQVLSGRTLLLEYALGEERSYLWAVTPDMVQSFLLPARKEIEALALDFYNALTARNNAEGAMHPEQSDIQADRAGLALSRAILGPVESLLGDRILLVVSDGVLQYVPFVALPLPSTSNERVLARNEVVSLPSASTLNALRRQIEGRPPAPKTLAVLADPVYEGDPRLLRIQNLKTKQLPLAAHRGRPSRGPDDQADQLILPPLPFSAEEANNILALVPEGQQLGALDFEASYRLATSGELADYRYVHFATHGLLNSQQAKLSKLALSQFRKDGQRQEESFLRLADIYNLNLNADLVALSACKTALGKEVRGEGLVGLTRGFMYAGSARVLASLWSVEDRATAKLMKSFYRNLLVEKRPAAESLQRAQIEMAGKPQYRSPYYWAGFSLQGEWK